MQEKERLNSMEKTLKMWKSLLIIYEVKCQQMATSSGKSEPE